MSMGYYCKHGREGKNDPKTKRDREMLLFLFMNMSFYVHMIIWMTLLSELVNVYREDMDDMFSYKECKHYEYFIYLEGRIFVTRWDQVSS